MKLVFVSSELAPLAQTGGLGDAVAGLAAALVQRGHEVTCVLPCYAHLRDERARPPLDARPGPSLPGVGSARWLEGTLPSGVKLRLLDAPGLYEGEGLYADGSDPVRDFASLSHAAARLAIDEQADVLVAHDWHAALAPAVLHRVLEVGSGRRPGTVQVVHNNAHQGRFAASAMGRTGLPDDLFQPEGLEFYGDLCLLKAGLVFADRIVAVSPGYATELSTPEGGNGLDGLFRARADRLVGIANGIDTERYDPATDAALPATFSADHIEGRARCRAALLRDLDLEAPAPGRLLVAIGRFAHQKGWDVLADALPGLVEAGASVALLGDGDPEIAASLAAAEADYPGRVRLAVAWDEPLSRRMYAAGDAVLVPSRFEPCGLVQLLGQRYGCLPIAHAVGGLVDTIRDGESGVLFSPLTAPDLIEAVERGAALVGTRGSEAVARDLTRLDVSWTGPAERWERLLLEVADADR